MDYDICDMRFINLNSKNATLNNGSFISDVRFNFRNILSEESDIDYVTIGILNAQIPVSFYTINYTNNTLVFKVDSDSTFTMTITRGNYNSNSLIEELTSQFTVLGYTFNILTSRTTGIMTFQCVGRNFTFYGTSTIFQILGFVSGSNYVSSLGYLSPPYPLNLLGIKRIKINSSALSTQTLDSLTFGVSSNIASIPVNVASFGLIDYVNTTNAFSILTAKTITYIDIQVADEDGNLINFNAINWSLTLQMNVYRKGKRDNVKVDLHAITDVLSDIKDELNTQQDTEPNDQTSENTNISAATEITEDTTNPANLPMDDELELLLNN